MACADDEQPSYQRALQFLRDNEPERRLDIQLSYENFRALEEKAHVLYGDAKYPSVEYAASDSRVTIYTVPTALHSRSSVNLQEAIRDSVRDILIQHNKKELMRYILSVGETTEESANDQGVSEGYRALKRDIELWLNEFQCPTCILFWLNENPRFGYPTEVDKYSVTEGPTFDEAMQQARNNHPFGPLTKAFMKYSKGMQTPESSKNGTLVVDGDNLKLGLTIGDFFPDVSEIDSIREVPIEVATNLVGHFLASAAQSTAEARFNWFVRTS